MLIVENTEQNSMKSLARIQEAVATMAIEDMYFSKEFIEDVLKASKGEKTHDEIRKEIIKKHTR